MWLAMLFGFIAGAVAGMALGSWWSEQTREW